MKTLLISLLLCGVTANVMAKTRSVSSPDQQIEVIISDELGFPSYQVKFQQQSIVQPSRLGLRFLQTVEFGEGFHLTTSQQSTVKQHWQQPWGEQEWIDDHHNQLTTTLSNGRYQFQLIFRVYNDGIGFRYLVPKQTGLTTLVN